MEPIKFEPGAPSQSGYQYSQNMNNTTEQRPPLPPTHLVWAVLTTLFCCLPFGIVAIVKASKVERYYFNGLYAEALEASDDAKKWSIIAAIVGGIGLFLYFIFFVILAAASSYGSYGY